MEPLITHAQLVTAMVALITTVIGLAALCFSWQSHRDSTKWRELVRAAGGEQEAMNLISDLQFGKGLVVNRKRGLV